MLRSLALLLVAIAPPPAPTSAQITKAYLRHERTGEYQYFGLLPADWKSPYAADRNGVPLVDYPSGPQHNPVTTAQYGLAQWTIGLRRSRPKRIQIAIRMADWLVRTQQRQTGKWLYRFDYSVPGAAALHAPWASALAQGQAISLLRRTYERTGQRRFLRAARLALRPLRQPVRAGGLLRHWRGLPFYEEYPTGAAPTFVLNGFQQCLLGLYDLSDVSPIARRLFRRGMRTLVAILPSYDIGQRWSTYSLAHLYWPSAPAAATSSYHLSHVGMLRLLDRLRPNPRLRHYARLWLRGLQPTRDYSRGV